MIALLHPNFLVSFPIIPSTETIKLRIRAFFRARKNLCRTGHYEAKCRNAIWLQAREALWSNCKRTKLSESRFFLCSKYELLLRSLQILEPQGKVAGYATGIQTGIESRPLQVTPKSIGASNTQVLSLSLFACLFVLGFVFAIGQFVGKLGRDWN